MNTDKKITKATLKSFVKKNFKELHLSLKSSFDGMIDGLSYYNEGFEKACFTDTDHDHTLGIHGVWLVGQSRDYFKHYEDDQMMGIEVYNSCGNFIVAVKKQSFSNSTTQAIQTGQL